MADEILVQQSLVIRQGRYQSLRGRTSLWDQSGRRNVQSVHRVGSTEDTLAINTLMGETSGVTPGWFMCTNVGSYAIKIGPATGVYLGQIEPGESWGPVRLLGTLTTLYLIAAEAGSDYSQLEFLIAES